MMTRKFLEDMGLDKEQVDRILDENSQDIGKAKSALASVQTELQNAKAEIDSLNTQLTERDTQLSDLKKSTDNAAGLKKQISDLQETNKKESERHQAEIRQLKIDAAVEAALLGAKAKNTKAVKALLNLDGAAFAEDGTIKGLSEQIASLSKADDTKFLFDSAKPNMKGANVGESGNDDGEKGVDTSKMTYSELAAYLTENPDAKL